MSARPRPATRSTTPSTARRRSTPTRAAPTTRAPTGRWLTFAPSWPGICGRVSKQSRGNDVSEVLLSHEFDAYWDAVDAELARYDAAPELDLLPLRCTDFARFYTVRLTSIGPYRIFGYYSVPVGDGPFPGLLITPRYGSVNNPPHYDDRERYAVLVLMHRGQRLADQPFAATYPGLLTLGIDDPRTYIYRSIVADCLRGAEFLLGRPEVDTARVGIVGDDLALLTAARRAQFSAARIDGLMFYRMLEACARSDEYPIEEINDYLRSRPEQRAAVAQSLA